jgi:sugar phosphate isomerase/epimerase
MAAVLLALVAPLRAQVSFGTIEEDPELVKAKIRQKVEDDYKEGMKAKAAGNVQRAVECFIRCAKTRCDTEYPELAFNELKTYHAQANQELEVARQLIAGEDPAAALKPVLSRTKHIHIRDCLGRGPSPGTPQNQACGRGDIDLFAYCKVMVEGGYNGPVCLEVIGAGKLSLPEVSIIAAESCGYLNACLKQLKAR